MHRRFQIQNWAHRHVTMIEDFALCISHYSQMPGWCLKFLYMWQSQFQDDWQYVQSRLKLGTPYSPFCLTFHNMFMQADYWTLKQWSKLRVTTVLHSCSQHLKKYKKTHHPYHRKATNLSTLQSLQTSSEAYSAPQVYSKWGVKQTIHFLLVSRLRMSGTIPPLSNMPPGHAQAQLYLYLSF
jgi:hypothetical protein